MDAHQHVYITNMFRICTELFTVVCVVLIFTSVADGLQPNYRRRGRVCAIPTGREYTKSTVRRRYGNDIGRLLPGNKVKHNTEVIVVCDKHKVGDMIMKFHTRTCRYGRWNKGYPKCNAISAAPTNPSRVPSGCRYTVDVTNATPNIVIDRKSRYPHGTTIKYKCTYGHRLVGNRKRKCNAGKWTPVRFKCLRRQTTTIPTRQTTTPKASTTQSSNRIQSSCHLPAISKASRYWYKRTGQLVKSPFVVGNNRRIIQLCRWRYNHRLMTSTCVSGRWEPKLLKCTSTRSLRRSQRAHATCSLPGYTIGIYRDGNTTLYPADRVDHARAVIQQCYQHTAVYEIICIDGNWIPPFLNCTDTSWIPIDETNASKRDDSQNEEATTKLYDLENETMINNTDKRKNETGNVKQSHSSHNKSQIDADIELYVWEESNESKMHHLDQPASSNSEVEALSTEVGSGESTEGRVATDMWYQIPEEFNTDQPASSNSEVETLSTEVDSGESTEGRVAADMWYHKPEKLNTDCGNGIDVMQETEYSFFDESAMESALVPTRLDATKDCFQLCLLHTDFVCRAIQIHIDRRNKTVCKLLSMPAMTSPSEMFLRAEGNTSTYRIHNRMCDDKCKVPDAEDVIFSNVDGVSMVTGQNIFPGTTLDVTCNDPSMTTIVNSVTCMSGKWNTDDVTCFV